MLIWGCNVNKCWREDFMKLRIAQKISFKGLTFIVALFFFYVVSDNNSVEAAVEETVIEPVYTDSSLIKERIQNFSEKEQKALMTQAVEKQYVLEAINQTFESYSDFEKVATVYLTDEGKIVIGLKETESEKLEMFKTIIKGKDINNKIEFKKVENSITDLMRIRDTIVADLNSSTMYLNTESIMTDIDVENNIIGISIEELQPYQLEAVTEVITNSTQINAIGTSDKTLLTTPSIIDFTDLPNKGTFSDLIIEETKIELKKHTKEDIPNSELSRKRNWTKLGGGITLHDANTADCTSAGMAKKGSTYFLLTAGHCLNADNSYVYQDSAIVGIDHSIGSWNRTDVGLIKITDDNTLNERRASNHFYEYAENLSDYDQSITGAGVAWQNEYVCKSGNATGVTCGYIFRYDATYTPRNYNYTLSGSEIQSTSVNIDYSTGGDSGSITYDPSTNVIYGVHSAGINSYGYMTRIQDVIKLYSDANNAFTIYTSNSTPVIAN